VYYIRTNATRHDIEAIIREIFRIVITTQPMTHKEILEYINHRLWAPLSRRTPTGRYATKGRRYLIAYAQGYIDSQFKLLYDQHTVFCHRDQHGTFIVPNHYEDKMPTSTPYTWMTDTHPDFPGHRAVFDLPSGVIWKRTGNIFQPFEGGTNHA
jgi:hypothetical protein